MRERPSATPADEALELAALHARGNIKRFFDERGNLRPIHALTDEEAMTIASTETIIKNAKAGDGKAGEVKKLKITDRLHALELILKTHKLLTDVVRVENDEAVIAMLNRAKAVKDE